MIYLYCEKMLEVFVRKTVVLYVMKGLLCASAPVTKNKPAIKECSVT
jgi:hypothetical protein